MHCMHTCIHTVTPCAGHVTGRSARLHYIHTCIHTVAVDARCSLLRLMYWHDCQATCVFFGCVGAWMLGPSSHKRHIYAVYISPAILLTLHRPPIGPPSAPHRPSTHVLVGSVGSVGRSATVFPCSRVPCLGTHTHLP